MAESAGRPRHLVVLVHGIGRHGTDKMEPRRADLQEMVNDVMDLETVDSEVEVIVDYIEWHEDLHQLHGLDDAVDMITIEENSAVRTTVRDTVVDALAYLASYHDRMQASVVTRLNRKWAEFMAACPKGVTPTVTLLAHSLGSMILWDLLAIPGPSPFSFPLHRIVFIGSPIALFMTARQTPRAEIVEWFHRQWAEGTLVFNVFHPSDPVAYRIEPLLDTSFCSHAPEEVLDWKHDSNYLNSGAPSNNDIPSETISNTTEGSSEVHTSEGLVLQVDGLCPPLSGRVDYQLSVAGLEVHEFITALFAHRSYWKAKDLVRFLVDWVPGIHQAKKTRPPRRNNADNVNILQGPIGPSKICAFAWGLWMLQWDCATEASSSWPKTVAACAAANSKDVFAVTRSNTLSSKEGVLWVITMSEVQRVAESGGGGEPSSFAQVLSKGDGAPQLNLGQTNAIVVLKDFLYIFNREGLWVLDPRTAHYFLLSGAWASAVSASTDGTALFVATKAESKKDSSIWRIMPNVAEVPVPGVAIPPSDSSEASMIAPCDSKWSDVKGMVVHHDTLAVWAKNMWTLPLSESAPPSELTASYDKPWQQAGREKWDSTLAVTADQRGIYVATSSGIMPGSGQLWQVDLAGHKKLVTDKSWGHTKALVALSGKELPMVPSMESPLSPSETAALEQALEDENSEPTDALQVAEKDLARLEKEAEEAAQIVAEARERVLLLRAQAESTGK